MNDTSSQPSPAPLHGLLLAGGKSRRMGRDKATLQYAPDALPQWQSTTLLLQEFCQQVHISLRPDQPPPTPHLPSSRFVTKAATSSISHLPSPRVPTRQNLPSPIIDALPSLGPLTGILSAMKSFPGAAWLVVACDLPLLDAETIRHLTDNRSTTAWATAYRSSHDGLPEPLCAIYEPSARSVLEKYLQQDLRCPRKILINEAAHVQLLDLPNSNALANANTPEDFHRLSNLPSPISARSHASKHLPFPIKVLYFAILSQHRGLAEETVQTNARTVRELYQDLQHQHQLPIAFEHLKAALNESFCNPDDPLQPGDTVAFMPPVSGG